MAKGNLTREQKSRMVIDLQDKIEDLRAANEARELEVRAQGLGVSPLTRLACQVETLIHWAAPSEYARARFDYDVELVLERNLSPEVVGVALDEQRDFQAKMALAEQGRRESGLYVPETAATPSLVPGATHEPAVDPGATTIQTDGAIRPPARH